MADPFVGEIRMFGFAWAPSGWAFCDGTSLIIQQNQALYALLGKMYGGNGTTNFSLPDLRGRVPIGMTTAPSNLPSTSYPITYVQGAAGGSETVTLAAGNLPSHTHAFSAFDGAGDSKLNPNNGALAQSAQSTVNIYGSASNLTSMNPASVSFEGGGAFHDNMQPSSVTNFCIALVGLWPPRN